MPWTITLPRHVHRNNELTGCHWATKAKRKKADRELVTLLCRAAGVPPADGKRRVSLVVVLGPRQRRGDADCPFWKSLLDALVCAGALVDDSPKWCEAAEPVAYRRGRTAGMVVHLEDV
jgi:hypothetical protein